MTNGGFGYHQVWVNLPDWIRDLDIDEIRREVGIETATKETAAQESSAE
jgi:hypothetical protein